MRRANSGPVILLDDTQVNDALSTPTEALVASLDEYEDDVAGWINHVLDDQVPTLSSEESELSVLEHRVSHLSTRIQVVAQDTATQLEQTMDDISRTVPRLTYDLQLMRESGLNLQSSLRTIENKTNSTVDDTTSAALERLHVLSTIKSRMEASRQVLREAEAWSALESDVSGLIAADSYDKAGERLAEASRSMSVFQNTPEYETRRSLMVSLQNQLEAALSSALVAAINTRDVVACRSYYNIFLNIQRETEFRNYYNGSRRADIVTAWQNANLLDCDGETPATALSTSPLPFAEFFRRFLSDFLARINEEQTNIPAIFPDAQPSLSSFIQSTLDALTPSISQRLSGVVEYHSASALPEIVKAFHAAEEFAIAVEQIMGRLSYSSLFTSPHTLSPSAPATEPSLGRRVSKRSSMQSRRMSTSKSISLSAGGVGTNLLNGGGSTWEHALFEPFIDMQTDYPSYETRLVDRELARVTTSRATSDASRVLQERSAIVFGVVEDVLNRCLAFTHGYGAVGMVASINHVFKSFLKASERDLIPSKANPQSQSTSANSRLLPSEALDDLDYTPGDWSNFQLALHLLETCRIIRERLVVFESKVSNALIQVSNAFRLGRNDPQGVYLSGTTRGEAELLLQSSLNSAELHGLLESLDSKFASSSALVTSPGPSITRPAASSTALESVLFAPALATVSSFTRECQLFLQRTILKPLHAHLSSYATASHWAAPGPATPSNTGGSGGQFSATIPSFSLSPTSVIQRVAEGLLNLPRLFEVYAEDDDALGFSIQTLPFVNETALRQAVAADQPNDNDEAPSRPSMSPASTSSNTHLRRLSSSSIPKDPTPVAVPLQSLPSLSPEMISALWLSSLTLSLLSHFTTTILPALPSPLSAGGAKQLASDLAYLENCVRALNVEWEELGIWREVAEMSADDREKWNEQRGGSVGRDDGNSVGVGSVGSARAKEVWEMAGRKRGWSDS